MVMDVFTYAVTKEMRGASSTRLRRQSSLDQWMITNVMKFIFCFAPSLWIKLPKNEVHRYRMCAVYLYADEGQINVLSVHSRPPVLTVAVKDNPCFAQDVQWSTLLQLCSMWTMLGSSFVLPNQSCHYFDNSFRWWSFKDPHSILGYTVDKLLLFGGKHDFLLSPRLKAKVKGPG